MDTFGIIMMVGAGILGLVGSAAAFLQDHHESLADKRFWEEIKKRSQEL